MADQRETTLSIVFGRTEDDQKDRAANQQQPHSIDDRTDSVSFVENVVKQALKRCDDSGGTDSTTDACSASMRNRIDDRRLQAVFDHRGGPDFKAQADSRSIVGNASVVRAQPVETPEPADFYARVRHGRCIVNVQEDEAPVNLIPAIQCASEGAETPQSKIDHASAQDRKKTRNLADERRFWLRIIFLATFLNFLLVVGITTTGLYLSGNFPSKQLVPNPPAPIPVPESNVTGGLYDMNGSHDDPTLSGGIDIAPGAAQAPTFAPMSQIPLSPAPTPVDTPKSDNMMSPFSISMLTVVALIVEMVIIGCVYLLYSRWEARDPDHELIDMEAPLESIENQSLERK